MELGATCRRSKFSSLERLVAIGLAVLAVASPLFIDRRPEIDLEDEQPISFASWLLLLLFVLTFTIAISGFLDQSFTRFDPHWIHRVGGSSVGITMILIVLLFVLKCKASETSRET